VSLVGAFFLGAAFMLWILWLDGRLR